MAALPPYIPNRDSLLDAWASNFATLIAAAPASYGLTSTDSTNITAAQLAFHSAYTPVTSASTKTAAAVSTKNTAKVTMLALLRPYAQTIALNPAVASASKIGLGLNPRTSTPSPVTPPASNPVLTVQSASSLAIVLRYRDSAASPSVKSKPYGVLRCEVRYQTSATPITDPTLLTGVISATRSPFQVLFAPADAGKQCYFAARWATRTGGFSPWSPVVSFTVPQGG